MHWFVGSLNHCFIDPLGHWFIASLLHCFTDSLNLWLNGSSSSLLIHCFFPSSSHWLIGSLAHWFIDSLVHWFIQPVVHGFFHLLLLASQQPFAHLLVHFTGFWHLKSFPIGHILPIVIYVFRNFLPCACWALLGTTNYHAVPLGCTGCQTYFGDQTPLEVITIDPIPMEPTTFGCPALDSRKKGIWIRKESIWFSLKIWYLVPGTP